MKKILAKIAFVLIVVMLASTVIGCVQIAKEVTEKAIEAIGEAIDAAAIETPEEKEKREKQKQEQREKEEKYKQYQDVDTF